MSSLKFGTSGVRGLVTDLLGEPSRLWTTAFLSHLESSGAAGDRVLMIGRDLRSSSPHIARDCIAAASARGWQVVDCGALPTPALALAAMQAGACAVMVTGSHIPDDRNGLKFYTAAGEITKADEAGILAEMSGPDDGDGQISINTPTPNPSPQGGGELGVGVSVSPSPLRGGVRGGGIDPHSNALSAYIHRYLDFFASDALAGLTIGVYQQSSVARDVLVQVLESFGATAMPFERADHFIPVDTEAHRPEDLELLRRWAAQNAVDAIVSADGDADRPLVTDARGEVVRGDLLGLLTASYLRLGTIVTPITSSAAVETSGVAETVIRTKVGSPFVIDGMERARAGGATDIVGFEANGGVLLGSDAHAGKRVLTALPTRDAVLPVICALAAARAKRLTVRQTVDELGAGHALADRLKEISAERSQPLLQRLAADRPFADVFFAPQGRIAAVSDLDGVRFELDDRSTIHFRASGNAPEFRCYVEAASEMRAAQLLEWGLARAKREM